MWPPAKEDSMKRSPRPRWTQATLPASLHQRLTTYALTAGATGVSLLAVAQPSEAEIVYTPANATISRNGSYSIDLNHDGIVDFTIVEQATGNQLRSTNFLWAAPATTGNAVRCPGSFCTSGTSYAAAMRPGKEIGPSRFGWDNFYAGMAFQYMFNRSSFVFSSWGWARLSTERYLGLQFQIDGETHYGWARLTVKFLKGAPNQRCWEAHLTGFAYETIVDKSIKAGQTTEETDEALESLHPGSLFPGFFVRKPRSGAAQLAGLGSLALGAAGLALWRREKSETSSKSEDH
jgi:hypothetical protein